MALYALQDEIRENAAESIALAARAGIESILITGDHLGTAMHIAKRIGLFQKDDIAMTGAELAEVSDEALLPNLNRIRVFARVSPKDKLRIVKLLKAKGHAVAMTGDGVNDAPALKMADIGVSVGSGTDVAKETADVVLLDNAFSTIGLAIKEGRVIYDNMKKIVAFLLITNFMEITLTLLALLFNVPLPLLPIHILWINLVTDTLPALALAFEPAEVDIMERAPRKRDTHLVDSELRKFIFIAGMAVSIALFAVYFLGIARGTDLASLRSLMFTGTGLSALAFAYALRSLRAPIGSVKPLSNGWLITALLAAMLLQVLPLIIPHIMEAFELGALSMISAATIGVIILLGVLAAELIKWSYRRE
jgi:Ca2+-transporting ATPase